MHESHTITLAAKGSSEHLLAADQGERMQPMRGFDDTYVDIVDYIVRVTHRIWEEKDIGYIYDTYRHNCRVTDDTGLQYGRDKIVADTVHTINAFPDVRLYADEVIWAGDEAQGFSTSHRTVIVGHNTGYSRFGPPTGRKAVVWAIANCRAIENEIFEEWVLYNQSSLLQQLGFDVRALARRLGNERAWDEIDDGRFGEPERVRGQGKPTVVPAPASESFEPEAFIRHLLHQVWNWRNLSAIDHGYAANLRYLGASGRQLYGRGELKSLILSFLAMFPDLVMLVDDVYWMLNGDGECLMSVRWSIVGTHRGHGIYGPPTGRRVLMWGISQYRIVERQILQEWTLFNEFEMMQRLFHEQS